MLIRKKGFIARIFCKHDYREFKKPIDKKKNPYGFVSLNEKIESIWVCIECGKEKK